MLITEKLFKLWFSLIFIQQENQKLYSSNIGKLRSWQKISQIDEVWYDKNGLSRKIRA